MTTPQQHFKSSLCLLHKLYISPNELAEHSIKQFWKEMVPQKHINDNKNNGKKSGLWSIWTHGLWTRKQIQGSVHHRTKKLNENGALMFFSRWIFKSPHIEYKPLRWYPSNVLTSFFKQHLLFFFFFPFYTVWIYIYICTYKFNSLKFS